MYRSVVISIKEKKVGSMRKKILCGFIVLLIGSMPFSEFYAVYAKEQKQFSDLKDSISMNNTNELQTQVPLWDNETPKTGDGFTFQNYENGIEITGYQGNETHVVIPSTINGKKVISIGVSAFGGAFLGMKSITLPSSLVSIKKWAFQSSELTSIHIPSGVKEIEPGAFANCANLKTITVDEKNLHFIATDNVLYSKNMKQLYYHPVMKKIQVLQGVEEIIGGAFTNREIYSITLPSSLKVIGNDAFHGCFDLSTIQIPEGVVSIGENAFFSSPNLNTIQLPESLMSIGEDAFMGTALTEIYIPRNVKTIGHSVFRGCSELKTITVHKDNSFFTSLNNVLYSKDKQILYYHPAKENIKVIPGVKEIYGGAFSNTGIISVSLPEGLQTIGDYAFDRCSSLESIDIPDSVTFIGYDAFLWNDSLVSLKLPENLKEIGSSAFEGCFRLKSIVIPKNVTRIGGLAFKDCFRLESVIISEQVEFIGNQAFDHCLEFQQCSNLVISVYKGSYAYDYVIDNGLNHKVIGVITMRPVSNLEAYSVGTQSVQLQWEDVKNADGYLIYRQNSQKKYSYCGMSKTSIFTDSTALTGEHNFYWVYPYKEIDGKKVVGNPGKYVYATPIPASTNNLKAVADGATVRLTWDKVNDVDGYIIYRQLPGEKNMRYRYTVTGTGFIDSNAQLDGFNFYRIYPYKKVNGKNVTAISNQYVYAKPTLTNVTKLKAVGKANKQIQISWNKYSGADGYIVYRQDSNTKQFKYRLMTSSTGFNDTVEKANTYYYYRVYPYKNVNGKRVIGTSNTYVYAKSK